MFMRRNPAPLPRSHDVSGWQVGATRLERDARTACCRKPLLLKAGPQQVSAIVAYLKAADRAEELRPHRGPSIIPLVHSSRRHVTRWRGKGRMATKAPAAVARDTLQTCGHGPYADLEPPKYYTHEAEWISVS